MIESRLEVKNQSDETLVGLEDRPDEFEGKLPAVIFVHGFYGTKDERGMFAELARDFVDAGMVVYRFDLSGCGESQGDYSRTTLTKQAQDVRTITDAAKRQVFVDPDRLVFVGFSLGTSTILALQPQDARLVVFIGTVSHPRKVLQPLFGFGFSHTGISRRVTSDGEPVSVHPEFWEDLEKYDGVTIIRNWSVPILVVHNQDDAVVPVRESEALFDAALGKKQKIVVPAAGHAVRNHKVLKTIAAWCKERLGKIDTPVTE